MAAYAVLSAALAWYGSGITLKADIIDLLPSGAASGENLRLYLERFGTSDAVLVTARAEKGAAEELLEDAARRLAEELERTGLFRTVRAGFDEEQTLALARHALDHLPVLVPEDRQDELRARLSPDAVRAALERARRDAAGPLSWGPRAALLAEDPLELLRLLPSLGAAGALPPPDPATGLFIAPDGRAALVQAQPRRPPQDLAFSRRLVQEIEPALRRALEGLDGITAEAAGGYLFAVQDEARIRHDVSTTTLISMSAILVLFGAALRRAGLLVMLSLPLGLSMVWTLGAARIYPGHLNMVTVAFAAILLGMGDDALTHLYLRFREETDRGKASEPALRAALGSTGPSILLATLTSGLSFAALLFVDFRGLSELGGLAAIGLVNLLVSVLFLFPALLSILPPGSARRPPLELPSAWLVRFHEAARRHRGPALALAGLLAAGSLWAATGLRFSSDVRTLRGEDPAEEQLRRVLAPFGPLPDPVHALHDACDLDESLRRAGNDLPVWMDLRDEGLLAGWTSPALWLPSTETQRERLSKLSDVAWARAAATLRAEAGALEMREEYFAPFLERLERYGSGPSVLLDPAAVVREDPAAWASLGIAGTTVAATLLPAEGTGAAAIAERVRRPAGLREGPLPRLASIDLVVDDLTAIIKKDFRRALLIALCAVFVVSLAAFRSLSRLLLVAVPVTLGCLMMLAGLSLLGVPINLMNLVAVPLVFGLGVDFGVYIVNRHDEESRADVPQVLRTTGGAILLTGLTTMAGFGSLLSAEFAGLRSMGWVAVLGIGGCLASALLLLPQLLPPPGAGQR